MINEAIIDSVLNFFSFKKRKNPAKPIIKKIKLTSCTAVLTINSEFERFTLSTLEITLLAIRK